jgi:2,4-dienoyl-CoA reductase-like NADH-dependent reductase (Old Yellow Enzyme family)/thioredoxin reductase
MPSFNHYEYLFQPLKVGKTTFKNRVEFSPMVCNFLTSNGEVTQRYVDFVESQAAAGVSLVTLGATPVDTVSGIDYPAELDVTDDLKAQGLVQLVEAVHRHDAKISVELVHAGRGADPNVNETPYALAPSNIPIPGQIQYIKEMDQHDIDRVIACYVDCTKRLQRCGFDGVMVHGAHGNLVAQFLSPMTNHRTDIYGGSLENRARFPLMLLKALREAVGPSFLIELRISGDEVLPQGMRLAEVIEFLKMAQEYIDLVNVSAGVIVDFSVQFYAMPPYYQKLGRNVPYARAIKQCPDIHIPVSVVGCIVSADQAEQIIAEGSADMVAMARALLCDPELLKKSYRGEPETVRPCLRCFGCSSGGIFGGHVSCAVNPQLGRDFRYSRIWPAEEKKRVVVIGGGPAGLQAAMTLVKRGHRVVLFEKRDRVGGLLHDINKLPFKEDMLRYTEWLERTAMACGADIRLGTEATPELVLVEEPDAIVVAVGASPYSPPIPGLDRANVVHVLDVDSGRKKVRGSVVVCGGGSSGCESALALAMEGCQVTIVDQLPEERFAEGMARTTRNNLRFLLKQYDIRLLGSHIVRAIDENGVLVEDRDWRMKSLPADYVVDALGMRSNTAVSAQFRGLVPEVFVVGDAYEVGNLKKANLRAYDTASNI